MHAILINNQIQTENSTLYDDSRKLNWLCASHYDVQSLRPANTERKRKGSKKIGRDQRKKFKHQRQFSLSRSLGVNRPLEAMQLFNKRQEKCTLFKDLASL